MWRGVLTATLLAASIASAEPVRTARLETSGACPLTNIEARTSELLGRTAITSDAAAEIRVMTSDASDVTATLTFTDENGDAQPARTVTASSCDELAESVAIVISLVLREGAPLPDAPAPPAPAPAPPPPVEEAHEDAALAPVLQAHDAIVFELGAATSSAARSAVVLGGRLERGRLAGVADVAIAMPEHVDVLYGDVHVLSARGDAGACLRTARFAACGLLGAGLVRARGEDLMDASSAVRPLATLGLRAEWRQPVSRHLGVRLFASVEQLLVRPRFLVDDTAVWTEPMLQAWLGGGVFFHVP